MAFPYRADHVGSLLRPPELRAIRADRHAAAERVREIEDLHIVRALERQKGLGFEIFSDGEFRRGGFMSDFYDSVEGLDKDGSVARQWQGQSGTQGQPLKGVVVEKIRQTRRLTAHEAAFLQRHSPGDFKITLPSAAPYILTGAKLAVAYAFIGVIGAEFIMSRTGIGYEISFAYNNFDNKIMYPLILLILVVSILLNAILSHWEDVLMRRRSRS